MGEPWESDFKTTVFGDHHVTEWTRRHDGGTIHLLSSPRAFTAVWVPDQKPDHGTPVPPSRKKPHSE